MVIGSYLGPLTAEACACGLSVGYDLGELLMSSIAQSVSCMVNVIGYQCTSSLALKTFRYGAQVTSVLSWQPVPAAAAIKKITKGGQGLGGAV